MCTVDARGVTACSEDTIVYGYYVTPAGQLAAFDREPVAPVPFEVASVTRGLLGDASVACALGRKGELACAPRSGKFVRVMPESRFATVTIFLDEMWALDTLGNVWCRGSGTCAALSVASAKVPPGKPLGDPSWVAAFPRASVKSPEVGLWKVASGIAKLYASIGVCLEPVKSSDLVCWTGFDAPTKRPKPTRADEVVVAGAKLCVRTGDVIVCDDVVHDRDTKPTFHGVKNATRMYANAYALCVESPTELACTSALDPVFDPLKPLVFTELPKRR